MRLHALDRNLFLRALLAGIVTALLISAVMVPLFKFGVSPLPKPLGLAFAETLAGRALPLPVGLLFHLVYVTVWSVIYVSLFRDSLGFRQALVLALVLWLLVLVIFFPVVGWGFLGLAVGPQLIVASLVPHLLFAVLLWALCRALIKTSRGQPDAT